MKIGKLLGRAVSGIVISVLVIVSASDSALAANRDVLDRLVGGVSAILSPVDGKSATEVINEKARELNIELGKEVDISKSSNLVMANVHQFLNVREEPNVTATRVGLMYKDCGGTIIERADGWTLIKSGNVIGWCNDEYLLFDEEAAELAHDVGITLAKVNVGTLKVRDAPFGDGEIVSLLPQGDIHEVIGEKDGDWVKIDIDGADGYVLSEYVDITFSIDAGETNEEIRERELAELEAKRHVNYGAYTTDADTTLLLAALIQCEAGGEMYEGQVAVGAVVMNRVRSAAYPNSIHAVIYASGQFTPALNGKVNAVYSSGRIKQSCIDAAKETIGGVSNVGDMTHFRRNDGRNGLVIGNHVFY